MLWVWTVLVVGFDGVFVVVGLRSVVLFRVLRLVVDL